MCRFIETVQILNGKPLNLSFHEERFNRTRQAFYPKASDISLIDWIEKKIENPGYGKHKLTIGYGKEIESFHISEYHQKDIKTLRIIETSSLEYSYKYADREIFSVLKSGLDEKTEIIICLNGKVTDCSFANLVFFNGNEWITSDTPLLEGTKRKYLLEKGIIKEDTIYIYDISGFQKCSLINAMLDPGDIEIDIGGNIN